MSTAPSRVYAARLVGLPIFDPQGDQVGKVRDLVVAVRSESSQPRVLGMVAEVFGRRRIFVPMTRVTNIDAGQVYTTGLLNMRRFEQRSTETLVVGELFDKTVTITTPGSPGTVYDIGMEQARNRDWVISRVAVQEPAKALRRRGQTHVVEWGEVEGLTRAEPTQGATQLIHALNELRPADAASVIHDLPAGAAPRSWPRSPTSGSPTSSRSCPRRTRSRSSASSRASGPPTSWRRWTPTTPPT